MPVEFLYQREDEEDGVQTTTFPFPDDPYVHPPKGAIFHDAQGRSWTCVGKASEQPEKEPV